MEHPETYTLTREEWCDINSTLAGALLAMLLNSPPENAADEQAKHLKRINRVYAAQEILHEVYQRECK